MDQVVDRFIEREHGLMKALSNRTPVVETYLQDLTADPQLGPVPSGDHYFLGRMDMGVSVDRKDYLKDQDKGVGMQGMETRLLGGFHKLYKVQYEPTGFSWMVYADRTEFDRSHYEFHYIRREFLGDIRCLVFDVTPKKDAKSGKGGRFLGRIWVEDQDFNIVRLNGTYAPAPRNSYFFHMDSWRLNLIPGYWVPAYIYSEEGDFSAGVKNKLAFKAQTRIWGYDLKKGDKDDELTQIRVDSVKDETATTQDASPLQAEREWQQQAEDNVIERLTRAGLLAPEGDVDHILQTVVNNLEVTNNIDLPRPVRTRAGCSRLRSKPSASAIPSSSAADLSTCSLTRPASPRCSRMNWRTLCSATISAASMRSTTACCSPTIPPTTTSASSTFRKKKLQPIRKPSIFLTTRRTHRSSTTLDCS